MEGSPGVSVINGMRADLRDEMLRDRDGKAVALRPHAFATLRCLIGHANRLVTKDELMQAVWHGLAVTDDSLVQCIHEIRCAINDNARTVLQTVPKRGYRLIVDGHPVPDPPTGPSIAVLPFTSLDDNPAQAYFADGLIEDLITELSKIPGLLVIARNSSFAFRGQQHDVRRIAADLGVRYLLEGSVRRTADRLRISCKLIDGASAVHVWAGTFDGTNADLFDLQDQLTEQIVGVIEPSVRRAEIDRARRKRPGSLDAYDLYLQALPLVLSNRPADADAALALLTASLERDPTYVPAHGYAAWCREQRFFRNGFDPEDRRAALAHADIVLGVNSNDPLALSIGAFVRANLTRDYDAAVEVIDRALAMHGHSALVLGFGALVCAHSERHGQAIEHARKALRLSPLDDPLNYHPYCALAVSYLFAGQYAEAAEYATLTIRANPAFSVPYAYLVASQVNLGNRPAALRAAARLLEIDPLFTLADFERTDLFRPEMMAGIIRALRQAGLRETL